MNENEQQAAWLSVFKIFTAWLAALGITTWGDVASMFAAIYTALLICEWWWKKFWRPFFVARGWIKRRDEPAYDEHS